MKEKRKSERLDDFNEVIITIVSGEKNLPKGKSYNYTEDISEGGAKIRANILLPVDTILQVDFKLATLEKQITALGKVKWIKVIFEDSWYEAGVEFVDTPDDALQEIKDYISWKKQIMSLNMKKLKGFKNYEDFLNYAETLFNKPIKPTEWAKDLYLELIKIQDKIDPVTELKRRAAEMKKGATEKVTEMKKRAEDVGKKVGIYLKHK